jgi:glycosyltransferase involved in cell wall biosynthesis
MIDIVMWAKNGESTLPMVLQRINQVIPNAEVNQRILVDDNSTDRTAQIAKINGWKVIPNKGTGIGDGANTALDHVTTTYFASFEQDILLSPCWWNLICADLVKAKSKSLDIAAISGVRISDKPTGLRKLQEYNLKKYLQKSSDNVPYRFFKTLDNTLYKTSIIRQLGGFPRMPKSVGVDNILAAHIHDSGYAWLVDYNIVSTHLRKGLSQELNHNYWYGANYSLLHEIMKWETLTLRSQLPGLLFSPFRGLQVAIMEKNPEIIYIHPCIQLFTFRGIAAGMKNMVVGDRQLES